MRSSPVTVRIDDVPNDGGQGERDNVLSDVENVLGGAGNDTLVGSSANNVLRGLGGNDTLNGRSGNDGLEGGAGKDVLFGSAGVDTATYQTHPVGVAVTLDNKANDGRPNEADNVHSDVENLTGSNFNDTLLGSSVANVLRGLAGNDRLFGRAGNDRLIGDSGNDQGSATRAVMCARLSVGAAAPSLPGTRSRAKAGSHLAQTLLTLNACHD